MSAAPSFVVASHLKHWQTARASEPVYLDPPACVPAVQQVPVWLFVSGAERVVCTRPVQVTLREEDDAHFAECERLHVFASGKTRQEAVDSLHDQVVHFFHHYRALGADDVIGEAEELRRLYHRHFHPTQAG